MIVKMVIKLSVNENPTTGYRWEIAEIPEGINELEPNNYERSNKSEQPVSGSGGTRIFTFEIQPYAKGTIKLIHNRSWENDVAPIDTIEINISEPL